MGLDRILMITLGAAAMLVLTLLRRKQFPQVAVWKIPVLMAVLTVAGVLGTMLLFYVENGNFGGTSFYGAVLFVPVLMVPAMLLKLKFGTVMDLCAAAECAMLAVMKVDCLIHHCCFGKQMQIGSFSFEFPSAIVEMLNSIGVGAILVLAQKKMRPGSQYPLYMLVYGATRFVWNCFRYVKPEEYICGIPQGIFWSVVSMIIGALWLIVLYENPSEAVAEDKNSKSKKKK